MLESRLKMFGIFWRAPVWCGIYSASVWYALQRCEHNNLITSLCAQFVVLVFTRSAHGTHIIIKYGKCGVRLAAQPLSIMSWPCDEHTWIMKYGVRISSIWSGSFGGWRKKKLHLFWIDWHKCIARNRWHLGADSVLVCVFLHSRVW